MSCNHQIIKISGTPKERGLAYGNAARSRILKNLDFYKEFFLKKASISWDEAKSISLSYESFIRNYYPDALLEIEGIAEGVNVKYQDILTLNCRSEILFAIPDGCSCLGVLPEITFNNHTYLAQTWDWLMPAKENIVIVEIAQDQLPTLLIVTEAGIIGGKGLNSAGIGVCLNAMSIGVGQKGVPLHIMYRAILNSKTISDSLDCIAQTKRAGSGTFNIAAASGFAMSVEFSPNNFDVLMSEGDPLCHTNHYLSPLFIEQDTLKIDMTDSFMRLNRLRRSSKSFKGQFDEKVLFSILSDHANFPDSVCSHEDMSDPEMKRFCTIYAIAMDLDERTLWVSNGNPCEGQINRFILDGTSAN